MSVRLQMTSQTSRGDTPKKRRSQTNPRSLANLTGHKEQYYDEPKKKRNVSVTDTGWEGFDALAKLVSLSRSELIESLGRGSINLQLAVKFLASVEVLGVLELTPSQILEMPIIEVLKRIERSEKLRHLLPETPQSKQI